MKIVSVKYNSHPILGDLELDLTNPNNGQIYNNIVLAGQNGIGKSTILKTLNSFLCLGPITPFREIVYEVTDGRFKAEHSSRSPIESFFKRTDLEDGSSEEIHRNSANDKPGLLADSKDPRSYGSVLSQARADFKTDIITSTSSKELDQQLHNEDKEENFTSLKQLLIDIANQDTEMYSVLNAERARLNQLPLSWPSFETTQSKIYRFKKAFNNFFGTIKFSGVVTRDGQKVIEFKKGATSISIDNLSTGEKQIVFRGALLLKDLEKLKGATVFIDEPELSMHPTWQSKILQYYCDLFKDSTGNQIAQIFFATHSERVITEALRMPDTVVIVLTNNNGVVTPEKITTPGVLPTITAAETNYLAFKVYTIDYHIQLYGWLQEREGTNVKDTDTYIKNHAEYDSTLHHEPTSHGSTNYETISTFVRNSIDHPRTSNPFTEQQLQISIELLRKILSTP